MQNEAIFEENIWVGEFGTTVRYVTYKNFNPYFKPYTKKVVCLQNNLARFYRLEKLKNK